MWWGYLENGKSYVHNVEGGIVWYSVQYTFVIFTMTVLEGQTRRSTQCVENIVILLLLLVLLDVRTALVCFFLSISAHRLLQACWLYVIVVSASFTTPKPSAPVWMREISTACIYTKILECRSNVKHFLTMLV